MQHPGTGAAPSGWDTGAVDWLIARILAALAGGAAVPAVALTLLVRRYAATAQPEVADALGPALARAAGAARQSGGDRAAWLELFSEATAVTADERIAAAAADLITAEQHAWGDPAAVVAGVMRGVGAVLRAAGTLERRELVRPAIDELERVVGAAYRPGRGIAHAIDRPGERGSLDDHVAAASALLPAFEITGRLPYSMLAEELMQAVRRTSWDEGAGGLVEGAGAKPFAVNCEAARVFCRLATLSRSDDYRRAALVTPGADYAGDAARTLATQANAYRERSVDGAIFGLALDEWRLLARSS